MHKNHARSFYPPHLLALHFLCFSIASCEYTVIIKIYLVNKTKSFASTEVSEKKVTHVCLCVCVCCVCVRVYVSVCVYVCLCARMLGCV